MGVRRRARGWSMLLVAGLSLLAASRLWADQPWIVPTAEELAMTSQAEVPGATAVYLYREEVTDGTKLTFSYYVRLKVLTDGGKDYANVELPYQDGEYGSSIGNIGGRTIHPDGSVYPLVGKPYDKLLEKSGHSKVKAKVFTLPSVEVGSILEYRYTIRFRFIQGAPDWFVQDELYLRRGHFAWQTPTMEGGVEVEVSSKLPKGVEVKITKGSRFDLEVQGILPLVKESYMPPASSVAYIVRFYYSRYKTPEEFWAGMGESWSESCNQFATPGKEVKAFVERTVFSTDTPERKLKKLYEAVMQMDNTNYDRERGEHEQESSGLKQALSSDDVLNQKRGNSVQLTDLFVAMARAAGFKAYVAGVADRSRRLFVSGFLSFSQISEAIAIVELDGKDAYFDPGQRYCEFKHLAWQHTLSGGLRQTEWRTAIFTTPGESANASHVDRVADITLDERGEGAGTVKITARGDPARLWHEDALRGDETSLKADLRSDMEEILPHGVDVQVSDVQNLTDADKPLIVSYTVKGTFGAATGKRLLVPAHLFQVNATAKFPEAKRETMIMMQYASFYQDAIRLRLPDGMMVESAPSQEESKLKGYGLYRVQGQQTADSIFSYRDMGMGHSVIAAEDYAELRAFYSKLETKDQESIVLIKTTGRTSAAAVAIPAK